MTAADPAQSRSITRVLALPTTLLSATGPRGALPAGRYPALVRATFSPCCR
jgi:hypothetical protein